MTHIRTAILTILACGALARGAETRSSHLGGLWSPECNSNAGRVHGARSARRILSFSPGLVMAGAKSANLIIDGQNFTTGMRLAWKAGSMDASPIMLSTTFVSATRLTATIPENLLAASGKAYFAVLEASSGCAQYERIRIDASAPAASAEGVNAEALGAGALEPHATTNNPFLYTISTVAGNGKEGYSGDNGPATSAMLDVPSATAVDSSGNIYIADYGNHRVRKVSNGIITTVAGTGVAGFSGDGGPAVNAQLNRPAYVALDAQGNLYIAEQVNNTIRKVSNGIITTVAGIGAMAGFSGDGGLATSAKLNSPNAVAVDAQGNLYIADTGNERIRKVAVGGTITTLAGNGVGGFSGDNGPAASAMLQTPTGLSVDAQGNVYVADFDNERVRKISNGIITTVVGNGTVAYSGDGGPATNAAADPFDVTVDSQGNLYVVDDFFNQRIRKVVGGIINTIAGNGVEGYSGDGGLASQSELAGPEALSLDSAGNVYVTDTLNFRIRKLTPGNAPLQFFPITPCRVLDTRNPALGGPFIPGNTTRNVPVQSSPCGIPIAAQAYSLNITAVPRTNNLGFLTVWPQGQPQPTVSTLNSPDGSVLANAAIVLPGSGGGVSVFATSDTDLVIDINGYFGPPAANSLQFYPLTPCRVLDTRNAAGAFGGPALAGGVARSFPIASSPCGVPAAALAYSFNVTVVPRGQLGYLTAWPTGQPQPLVSTLNSLDGTVLANAALVPSGVGGAVSFYASNPTDLVVDINGYFAPPGAAGLNFYTVTPCRVVDTRNPNGPLGGPIMGAGTTRAFPVPSACSLPANASAYSLNMTVVPQGPLGFLTTWPTGLNQPVVSTLNAPKGIVVANAAIVPAGTSGSINVFVTNPTHVVIDTNGYFAP